MRPAIIAVNCDKLSEKKVQLKWKSLKEKSQKDTNTCVKIAAFRLVSKTIKEKKSQGCNGMLFVIEVLVNISRTTVVSFQLAW